jgi:hypothetical protein
MVLLTINHLVALLGLVLALSSYLVLKKLGVPDKICIGGAILSVLVVAIFWTSVLLGTEDEDEE